jgi:hypothetical protein
MYDYDQAPDDDYDEYDTDDDWCPECQGTGRVPALDFEAITGATYFGCSQCEKGLNSGYPFR